MTQVRISKNNFQKGVKYAKQVGGKFDGMSKTWTLPNTQRVGDMLNAPGMYGWVVVSTQPVDLQTVEGAMALEDC